MRRALSGFSVLSLVLVGTSVAQPRLADDALLAPAIVWRGFQPLVTALGEGVPTRAVAYVRATLALVQKAEEHLDCDAATLRFREQALASIADLDLKQLYQRLPSVDGSTRFFALWGAPTRDGYLLRTGHGAEVDVHAKGTRRGFGDVSSLLSMRHVQSADNARYAFEAHGGVGVGDLSWPAIAAGGGDALALLNESAPANPAPLLLQTADSHLKRSQPALHEADRVVLARFAASFPRLFKEFDQTFRSEDVIADAPRADGSRRVHFVARWDLGQLTHRYPALTKFLQKFGDLLAIKGRLVDAHDKPVARFSFDTEHLRIVLDLDAKDGEVVLLRDGATVDDASTDFTHMKLRTDVHLQAYGLQMDVEDFVTELWTKRDETGASLRAQMRRTPHFRASGTAFGIFSARMLDWLVPGDIDSLARKMLDVTMKGNGGKGVLVQLDFARPTGRLATVDGAVALEILDTRLIRFGMKIAADRVLPDAEATRELAVLVRRLRAALRDDVERFAHYIVSR